jgi:hypothetical protein
LPLLTTLAVVTPAAAAYAAYPVNPEREVNDTLAYAKANGGIGTDDVHRLYTGAITTANDNDAFVFYAPAGRTQVTFSVTDTSATVDYQMPAVEAGLFDAAGRRLTAEVTTGRYNPEANLAYTVKGPGRYELALAGDEGATYQFLVTSSRPLLAADPVCPAAKRKFTAARAALKSAKRAEKRHPSARRRAAVKRASQRAGSARQASQRACAW